MVSAIGPVNHSRYRAIMNIIAEEWRPVPGAEGRYEVSSLGRVKSLRRVVSCGVRHGRPETRTVSEKILKPCKDTDGYDLVRFPWQEKEKLKTCTVHKLVAMAFLGPKPEGQWVLHGPNGKNDNSVENLYYGTPAQNVQDKWRDGTVIIGEAHHKAKLKEADVIEIRRLYSEGFTQVKIAALYDVGSTAINKIVCRQNWKWL